ncbi:MAG: hypothetical protein ACI4E1_05010 [Lachnospira sp.]
MKKRIISIILIICMVMTIVPVVPITASAESNTSSEPSVPTYATKEQLMDGTFKFDCIGKLIFGKDSNGKPLEWYIGLKDRGVSGDNTIIFAASPIINKQKYSSNTSLMDYDTSWNCTYSSTVVNSIKKVTPTHYGGSDVRAALNSIAEDSNYFTSAEQNIMNATTIRNVDVYNNLVDYTTTDKLYIPEFTLIDGTLGAGSTQTCLYLGMDNYWDSGSYFWLRFPKDLDSYDNYQLGMPIAETGSAIREGVWIVNQYAVRPASNLNLSSVLFSSAAQSASSDSVSAGTIEPGTAMTLRFDGYSKDIGNVIYDNKRKEIKAVKRGTKCDVSLVVQGNDGTNDYSYSKKITGTEIVSVSDIKTALGLTSDIDLSKCKIWLEIEDSDGLIYAVKAKAGNSTKYLGSMFGTGSLIVIAVIAILLIVGAVITVVFVKKKKTHSKSE